MEPRLKKNTCYAYTMPFSQKGTSKNVLKNNIHEKKMVKKVRHL